MCGMVAVAGPAVFADIATVGSLGLRCSHDCHKAAPASRNPRLSKVDVQSKSNRSCNRRFAGTGETRFRDRIHQQERTTTPVITAIKVTTYAVRSTFMKVSTA